MNFEQSILLIGAFFLISMIYSAAGFGGGSSYLALLSFISFSNFGTIRTTALVCNIIVVSGSLIAWSMKNKWSREWIRKNISILMFSLPAAFIAGSFQIKPTLFYTILGITLIVAALFMFFTGENNREIAHTNSRLKSVDASMGGMLGGLAGLVGIGGGIFLSPYLHLSGWDTAKRISVATSTFILLNSIAGLSGQLLVQDYSINWKLTLPLALAVLLGGQIGIRTNMRMKRNNIIRILSAAVIFIAGLNVLWRESI